MPSKSQSFCIEKMRKPIKKEKNTPPRLFFEAVLSYWIEDYLRMVFKKAVNSVAMVLAPSVLG